MTTRRDALKLGFLAGGSSLLAARAGLAQHQQPVRFLCPPDDRPRQLPDQPPSPAARPLSRSCCLSERDGRKDEVWRP